MPLVTQDGLNLQSMKQDRGTDGDVDESPDSADAPTWLPWWSNGKCECAYWPRLIMWPLGGKLFAHDDGWSCWQEWTSRLETNIASSLGGARMLKPASLEQSSGGTGGSWWSLSSQQKGDSPETQWRSISRVSVLVGLLRVFYPPNSAGSPHFLLCSVTEIPVESFRFQMFPPCPLSVHMNLRGYGPEINSSNYPIQNRISTQGHCDCLLHQASHLLPSPQRTGSHQWSSVPPSVCQSWPDVSQRGG